MNDTKPIDVSDPRSCWDALVPRHVHGTRRQSGRTEGQVAHAHREGWDSSYPYVRLVGMPSVGRSLQLVTFMSTYVDVVEDVDAIERETARDRDDHNVRQSMQAWYRDVHILAVCRRERVFSEESALGGRFEVKIRATDAILPSHSTINEVGKLLSDRLLDKEYLAWVRRTLWGRYDPINVAPVARSGNLKRRFDALVEQWSADTRFLSSIQKIVIHPAYQQIIGMGLPALPFIFRDLPQRRSLWFWALHAITGEDPVKEGDSGETAITAWLIWGGERGYIL